MFYSIFSEPVERTLRNLTPCVILYYSLNTMRQVINFFNFFVIINICMIEC